MFKIFSFLVLTLGLLQACSNTAKTDADQATPKSETTADAKFDNWADFWTAFQAAIQKDGEAVAKLTLFPLQGGDAMTAAYDGKAIDAKAFTQSYAKFFDGTVREKILATKANEVEKNNDNYQLNIFFVTTDEEGNKTESQIMLKFSKQEQGFQLSSIDVAG